jgi:ATP-dependent DNA helicase RecQ
VQDEAAQAQAVLQEVLRLRALGVADWSSIAVLASTHHDLAQVRALAEQEKVPIRWCPGQHAMPSLHKVREIHRVLQHLGQHRRALMRATEMNRLAVSLVGDDPGNPWTQFLFRILQAWHGESSDAEVPVQDALEFLYEACAESKREFTYGNGVVLSTVHSAKGTEHDHVVLIGAWPLKSKPGKQEEDRRAFYVGMTRARQTLAIIDRADARPSLPDSLMGPAVLRRAFQAKSGAVRPIQTGYHPMGLDEIYIGYAGQFEESHPIHRALVGLKPGARLSLREQREDVLGLFDAHGTCVARLSKKATTAWADRLAAVHDVRVLALIHRSAEEEASPNHRDWCRVAEWEVPLVELVFKETKGTTGQRAT